MFLAISLHLRNVKRLIAEKQYNIQKCLRSKANIILIQVQIPFVSKWQKWSHLHALLFRMLSTSHWKHLEYTYPALLRDWDLPCFFSVRSFRSWIRATRHFRCQFLYHLSLLAISHFDHFSQAYIFCNNLFKQNNIMVVHFADRRGQEWGHCKKFNLFKATQPPTTFTRKRTRNAVRNHRQSVPKEI